MFSNTPIIVDNAANARNKKNRLPQIRPNAIPENTRGRVRKIRLGPAVGSIP
jgi:hypothetical protein